MKNKHKIFLSLAAYLTAALLPFAAFAADVHGRPGQLGFIPGASPVKHRIEEFHNDLLLPIITGITVFVLALLLFVCIRFRARRGHEPSQTTHNTLLEVIWTAIPVLILIVIIIPSMKLLYYSDKAVDAEMTLNVKGYQWYWGYEYPDHGIDEYLSYMVRDADLKPGQPRLLTTDEPVVLPVDTTIRILVTANDVLHAFAVPALGLKLDAVPGRINETWTRIEKEGTYYGQCSELCGDQHGFMPIMIHAVSKEDFARWVASKGGQMPAPGEAAVTSDPSHNVEGPVEVQAGE